jgi:hypothetical protein
MDNNTLKGQLSFIEHLLYAALNYNCSIVLCSLGLLIAAYKISSLMETIRVAGDLLAGGCLGHHVAASLGPDNGKDGPAANAELPPRLFLSWPLCICANTETPPRRVMQFLVLAAQRDLMVVIPH